MDRRIQLFCLPWSPFFILGTVFLTNGGLGWEPIPKLVAGAIGFGLYDLLLTEALSVRRIDIDPDGVTFHYLLHKERGRWGDLSPHRFSSSRRPYFTRESWSLSRRTPEGRLRANALTREQALAVLRYPGRPAWDVTGVPWEALVRETHPASTEKAAVSGHGPGVSAVASQSPPAPQQDFLLILTSGPLRPAFRVLLLCLGLGSAAAVLTAISSRFHSMLSAEVALGLALLIVVFGMYMLFLVFRIRAQIGRHPVGAPGTKQS